MLGRAKSCQWQVFVRRRPPKQGELRTDVSKATMFQGDRRQKDLILPQRSRRCGELNRGLQNLEKFQKDLILLVRSCCLGGLNRGLQNLETPCEGTVLFFSLVRKEPKVPQRFANLWTPGTIQSSVEEDFSEVFRQHESKPAFRTKRWRKGFESVRGSSVTA